VHKKTLTSTLCVQNLIKKRQIVVHKKTLTTTDSVVIILTITNSVVMR